MIFIFYFGIYLLNNRIQFFSPTIIPETIIDQLVVFNPHGSYFYIFAYIYPVLVFLRLYSLQQLKEISLFQIHFLTTALVANIFFFLFPTTIISPTSNYSLQQLLEISNWFSAHGMYLIYNTDQLFNCFPSLHVATAFVAANGLKNEKIQIQIIGYIIAILIAYSTLQVKQHFFYDVLGGIVLSFLCIPLSQKLLQWIEKYKLEKISQR